MYRTSWKIKPEKGIKEGSELFNLLIKDTICVDTIAKIMLHSKNYRVSSNTETRHLEVTTPREVGCRGEIYPSIFFSSAAKSNLHCMHPDLGVYLRLNHKRSIFVEENIFVAMEPIVIGKKGYIFCLKTEMPKRDDAKKILHLTAVEFSTVRTQISEEQYFVLLRQTKPYY